MEQVLKRIFFPAVSKSRSSEVLRTLPNKHLGRKLLPYLLIAPALGLLFVFVLYPIGYMLYLSLFDWNMIKPKEFVGFQNFVTMFKDPEFFQVLGNTLRYTFWTLVVGMGIALAAACFLKRDTRINRLLQSAIFLPYVMPLVSVAFIWVWLMDADYGLLNWILGLAGLPGIRWLQDSNVALYALILVSIWKSVGYNTLIILSAMQSVPGYLYEAARLDKSGPGKTFLKITLPMISPSLFFLTLMNLIACFKMFETVNIMTAGGPANSTSTLVYSIYQYGFKFYKLGYASAEGVVLMFIIGICTVLYFGVLSKRVYYR